MNLHFEELTGSDGARIGIASLDAEKSLNALSLPMILALGERLDTWAKEPTNVPGTQMPLANDAATRERLNRQHFRQNLEDELRRAPSYLTGKKK